MLTIKTESADLSYDSFTTADPPQLIIDIREKKREKIKGEFSEEKRGISSGVEKEEKKASQSILPSSFSRKKDQKVIVIDPGHGGIESGAKGKFGALEKDITLSIGLKLKNIIEKNLAFRVVLTRDKDENKSLEQRAAAANNNNAYVFISIHANGSYRREARGSETFFLSLNATDEEARRLAYMENNSSEIEKKIEGENEDNILMILWDMAQTAYLRQSSQLAESIQNQLNSLLGTKNRGIKQAPFKVLTGVACPAVLVEVAFISNPVEERKLLTEEFQADVAQAIYRGLLSFIRLNPQK